MKKTPIEEVFELAVEEPLLATEIAKTSRILTAYAKEARRSVPHRAVDEEGRKKLEASLYELHQACLRKFIAEASQMMFKDGKCPSGFKSCNGECIPDTEDCPHVNG